MRPQKPPSAVLDDPDDGGGAEAIAIAALLKGLEYDPTERLQPVLDPDALAADADALEADLGLFTAAAWNLVEPSIYVPNWHLDAIDEHLTAVTDGDIKDLLITMPPRHSKSLKVVVFWPVWEWVRKPYNRWVFNSYSFGLSVRDSIKRRKIIQSQWFQQRWGKKFALIEEQNTKIRYENDRHGFMLASSVGGTNTGEGGERIVADDPHNVKKAESEQIRQDAVDWWNITMSSRRNSNDAARIVVQQRVHEGDVAGDIIEKGGYVHLNLPTEFLFAGGSCCTTSWTVKATGEAHTWSDPRQSEGELLNPERFGTLQNEAAKLDLGDYQYAAQHGQNPTPPKGQIIQAQWLRYYGGPGQPLIPDFTRCSHPFTPLFSLDCSFKDHKDTDYVAGLGWAMYGADLYLMPIRIHKRLNFPDTVDAVAEFVGGTSLDNTKTFPGIYPQMKIKLVEDKANGSAVISTLQHRIPGMVPFEPRDNKEARLRASSWRFRAGNVYLPHSSIAPWIDEYVYELCAFPKARKDDYVDATSQALLFIGGDAKFEGEPVMTEQVSRWMGINDTDLSDSRSVWGDSGGHAVGGRSIWRP